MLKDRFFVAATIARKASPWVGIASMLLIAANDLKKNK